MVGRLRNLEDEGVSRSPEMIERGGRGRQGVSELSGKLGDEGGVTENPGRRA